MTNQRLKSSLILLLGIGLSASVMAQNSSVSKGKINNNHPFITQQAENINYRLKASVHKTVKFMDEEFTPNDSTVYHWSGTNHDETIIPNRLIPMGLYDPVDYIEDERDYYDLNLYSYYDSTTIYFHDYDEEIYELDYIIKNTFDSEGRVITTIAGYEDTDEFVATDKHEISYTDQGEISDVTMFYMDEEDWRAGQKHVQTFNNQGDLELLGIFNWNNDDSLWINIRQYTFSYDDDHRLIEILEQYYQNDDWVNYMKDNFEYQAGLKSKKISKRWNNNAEEWDMDYEYEYSYNNDNSLNEILEQSYIMNDLHYSRKFTLLYENNIYAGYERQDKYTNNDWEKVARTNFIFENGYMTQILRGAWWQEENDYYDVSRVLYHYNEQNLLAIAEAQDYVNGEWVNAGYETGSRLDLYYEEYEDGVAIDELIKDQLTIYPNPANDIVNIKLEEGSINHVQIVDALGKVVFETKSKFNAKEISIPVQHLASGIYWANIKIGNQVVTKSFVVNK